MFNFFLSSHNKSLLFSFVRDMFYEYLKKEERFVDYFMMDYFIYIAYKSLPNIQKLIDDDPELKKIQSKIDALNKTAVPHMEKLKKEDPALYKKFQDAGFAP